MKRKLLISIFCTLLIALWAYATLDKLTAPARFGDQLKLQPIPIWSVPLIQWGLPIIELATATLISIQKTMSKGLIISSILMTVFTFYVLFALTGAYGDIPCSCAGIISALHWRGHLVFNIFFLVISVAGYYLKRSKGDYSIKQKRIAV